MQCCPTAVSFLGRPGWKGRWLTFSMRWKTAQRPACRPAAHFALQICQDPPPLDSGHVGLSVWEKKKLSNLKEKSMRYLYLFSESMTQHLLHIKLWGGVGLFLFARFVKYIFNAVGFRTKSLHNTQFYFKINSSTIKCDFAPSPFFKTSGTHLRIICF